MHMPDMDTVLEHIDAELRDLKDAENANVEALRRIINRQAEVLTYLVQRVRDLETKLDTEKEWDEDVEEVLRLMAIDDSKLWKFRKHRGIYEAIATKGVEATTDRL